MPETNTWSPYQITRRGRELRQKVIAEGGTLHFIKAVIGTARHPDESVIDEAESVASYVKDAQLTQSYAEGTNHKHGVRIENIGYAEEVLVTEIGVYAREAAQADSEAVLYGYTMIPDGHIYMPEQSQYKVYEITLETGISKTEEVALNFDASGVFATYQDIEEGITTHNSDSAAHPDKASKIPPVMYELPLIAGVEPLLGLAEKCYYYKTEDGEVHIHIEATYTEGFTGGQHIAALPAGYTPKINKEFCGLLSGGFDLGLISVYPDGGVYIYTASSGNIMLTGAGRFIAAETGGD